MSVSTADRAIWFEGSWIENKTSEKDYVHVDGASGPQGVQRSVVEACSICGGRGRET